MIIQGLQKLTLLDYPGKVACTIFTGGCNFRCPFCHNGSLVLDGGSSEKIDEEEIFEFLKKRADVLDGVCISGGEPLLQTDVAAFLKRVRELGFLVKLDTNGSFPDRLRDLTDNGLVDYVAMDIKNSPENYWKTAGTDSGDLEKIRESVSFLKTGTVEYEFRTTVVREFHQRSDFEAIADWLAGASRYYLQQFAESPDVIMQGLHAYTYDIMEQALEIVQKKIPNAELRGL